MKISDGAEVKEFPSGLSFFMSNLDAFAGNSGSLVANSVTGVVEVSQSLS